MARNYNTSDEYMVERSETILGQFETDFADFEALDPNLNAAFAADWGAAIENAVAQTAGETVDDQMQQLTAVVGEKMELCRKKYIEVKYFFTRAFPNNKPVMKEMGEDDYERARLSQMRMIFFMENLHVAAERHKIQLMAKGYTQAKIDEIEALRTGLQAANKVQNVFKKGRPVLTLGRETVYNNCYAFTAQVAAAAEVVYADNPVKKALYVFEPASGTGGEFFEGEVPPNNTRQIDDFHYHETMRFHIRNTGAVELSFFLTENGTAVGNVAVVAPGAEIERAITDFAPTGNAIAVQNNDSSATGRYEVEES